MYEQIARYYDLTHQALTVDIPYVLRLAGAPPRRVLELGCGTGRLLLPLLKAGHQVTGVDSAEAMLARARARLAALPADVRARAALQLQSMETLALATAPDARFDLALLPYNTAMHLARPALMAALRRAAAYLERDGRFFIDIANPFLVADTPDERTLTLEAVLADSETGDTIVQQAANRLDAEAQTLWITWLYDATPAGGGAVHRTVVEAAYHYLYPHEWQLLLADAGLRLLEMAGGYDGEAFDEESERLLLLAAPG